MVRFRDWILPCNFIYSNYFNKKKSYFMILVDWFIAVQCFASLGFILIFVTLAFILVSFLTTLRFKIKFMTSITALSGVSCKLMNPHKTTEIYF
jgi:hypothetical protein